MLCSVRVAFRILMKRPILIVKFAERAAVKIVLKDTFVRIASGSIIQSFNATNDGRK